MKTNEVLLSHKRIFLSSSIVKSNFESHYRTNFKEGKTPSWKSSNIKPFEAFILVTTDRPKREFLLIKIIKGEFEVADLFQNWARGNRKTVDMHIYLSNSHFPNLKLKNSSEYLTY